MPSASRRVFPRWLAITAGIAILAGWFVYAVLLVNRIEGGGGKILTAAVQKVARSDIQEDWLAIYQHGRRAGYSHTLLRPQAEGYELTEELFLRLSFLEDIQDIFSRSQAQLASDYSLKSFTFRLQAGPILFRLEGKTRERNLVLVTWMAGQKQSEEIHLSGPIYLGGGMKSFIAQQRLKVGDTYRLALFDPTTLSQTLVPIKVEARETINLHSRDYEAFRVVTDFHGAQLRSWISAQGELLKEEGFLGMTLEKADADTALGDLAATRPVELVREAAVVPDRTIQRPRQLKRLRLQLTGIATKGLDLAGGRQQLIGDQLTITRESLEDIQPSRIPWRGVDMVRNLQPSLLIQSEAPELKRQASEIIGNETDALKAAELISAWVYHNVEKRPTLSIPSALEVWQRRAGDCNEHSVLFAALARAVGIPTRLSAGLLYVDGRFFYHAWNEVFVGKWVAVDALLNQVPADPTHIRLVMGGPERQVHLVQAIGKLGIRVLDYQ